jgi:hypothetical protein
VQPCKASAQVQHFKASAQVQLMKVRAQVQVSMGAPFQLLAPFTQVLLYIRAQVQLDISGSGRCAQTQTVLGQRSAQRGFMLTVSFFGSERAHQHASQHKQTLNSKL